VLEDTGIRKALRFLGWFAFNIPRATTAMGLGLLAGLVGVHLYLLIGNFDWPVWLMGYNWVLNVGWLAAGIVMVIGPSVATAQIGWFIGDFIAVLFLVMYVVSRIAGLPGAPYLAGWWDFPAGTFGMAFALGFVGLHLSILLGVMIARPQRRQWHH
jgi:hypothetical protein